VVTLVTRRASRVRLFTLIRAITRDVLIAAMATSSLGFALIACVAGVLLALIALADSASGFEEFSGLQLVLEYDTFSYQSVRLLGARYLQYD
jgi:hypothetical protein